MTWLAQNVIAISTADAAFVGGIIAFNLLVVRFGMWPYSLVTLPATITHELSHYFAAKALFAQPSFPSLWPRRRGDTWVMGSVSFVPNMLNTIPVALAPLLLIPLAILFIVHVMHPASGLSYLCFGWIAGNMIYASLPSRQDWRIAAPAVVGLLILAGLFGYFLHA